MIHSIQHRLELYTILGSMERNLELAYVTEDNATFCHLLVVKLI